MVSFQLIIEPASGGRYEHRLEAGSYVLGRHEGGADIVIPSPEVSRQHLRLTLDQAQCKVEDLGSTSGTVHQGQAITGSQTLSYPLELHLGTVKIRVEALTQTAEQSGSAGHYTKGKAIAKGGMGAVLEANDQLLGRMVAMKVVRQDIGESESVRLRFIREATVLARLEHPSIVPIYEMGRDSGGRLFYTMKKVEGRTLQAILDDLKEGDRATQQEFTLDRLLNVFRKICEAMAFAHSKGVIHRDLKPENVMVGEYGEVLVMDWGLAKILQDVAQSTVEQLQSTQPEGAPSGTHLPTGFNELSDSQLSGSSQNLTMDGSVMGSPQYMPPEQAEGKVGELDERSDIFSLGGILYSILTLRPPVDGRTVKEVLESVKSGQIKPPTHFNTDSSMAHGDKLAKGTIKNPKLIVPLSHCPGGRVPSALSSVAMKALAFAPEDRYAEVEDLARDVEAYQRGFATSAEKVGLVGQLVLLLKRHKGVTVSAGVAVALIAILTTGFMLKVLSSERKAVASAAAALDEAKRANAAEKVALEKEEEVSRSLARSRIAEADAALQSANYPAMARALEACPENLRDQSWTYLWNKLDASAGKLAIPGFEKLTAIEAVPGHAGLFAAISGDGKLGIVDVTSRKVVRLLSSGAMRRRKLAFSADGTTLALFGNGKQVDMFEWSTGRQLKGISGFQDVVYDVALNHNGSLLSVIFRRVREGVAEAELHVIESATGKVRWQKTGRYVQAVFNHQGDRLTARTDGRSRTVLLFDVANGENTTQLGFYATCMSLHPQEDTLAIGSLLGEVLLINLPDARVIQSGKVHSGGVNSLAWTKDGHLLTMGSEGKYSDGRWLFRLWDAKYLELRATFAGLNPGKMGVGWALNQEGGDLITVDDPPRIWRIPVGLERAVQRSRSEQAWSGAFLSDNLVLARKGFNLVAYDVSIPGHMDELTNAPVISETFLTAHPSSGRFVAAQMIGQPPFYLRFFEMSAGEFAKKFEMQLPSPINDLAFNDKGDRIAVASRRDGIKVMSAADGSVLTKIPEEVRYVAFAGPGNRLIASKPGTLEKDKVEYLLEQLDGATGKVLSTVTNRFRVQSFALSADRKMVALGGADYFVYLFDTDTLELKSKFRAHDGEVGAMAFHPSKPVIVTASADGAVKFWDYRSMQVIDQYLGLGGAPVVLSFSPNGRLLLVDGQEHLTRLYDVRLEKLLSVR